jgi:hypothetical protein
MCFQHLKHDLTKDAISALAIFEVEW